MKTIKGYLGGVAIAAALAVVANFCSSLVPMHLISGSVFALLIGMALHPLVAKYQFFSAGVQFTAQKLLRLAIVLMGVTLSFSQIFIVGKYSLIVMCFTLFAAFGGGYLLGKAFGMNWKLSSLISAGTGICGGSAVAAIAPTIGAEDSDIAYAISATFLFDVLMVILFPIAGRYFQMSDVGFGLWTGTAVNDTSSVLAAGYAFSDAAGAYSVIVKLTRTLSIIPIVIIFSLINQRVNAKASAGVGQRPKVQVKNLFPYFILMFLAMVAIKSTGIIPPAVCSAVASCSKFLMVMALGAIGLKTKFTSVMRSGMKPMLHGFLISALVVVVSFVVQMMLGQV